MITLTHNSVTAHISDRLDWQDEFSWSPVDQATSYSTTGALLVDVALKQAGRPITLMGTETAAWITRALCSTLQAWAELPGIQLTLVLRGQARQVMFDHARGGFVGQPVFKLQDGEETPEQLYLPIFRFIEV